MSAMMPAAKPIELNLTRMVWLVVTPMGEKMLASKSESLVEESRGNFVVKTSLLPGPQSVLTTEKPFRPALTTGVPTSPRGMFNAPATSCFQKSRKLGENPDAMSRAVIPVMTFVTVIEMMGLGVGLDVGTALGSAVGTAVGFVVGLAVGRAEGSALGMAEGKGEGRAEGVVGKAEGTIVGSAEGSTVGFAVGIVVGFELGSAVGS